MKTVFQCRIYILNKWQQGLGTSLPLVQKNIRRGLKVETRSVPSLNWWTAFHKCMKGNVNLITDRDKEYFATEAEQRQEFIRKVFEFSDEGNNKLPCQQTQNSVWRRREHVSRFGKSFRYSSPLWFGLKRSKSIVSAKDGENIFKTEFAELVRHFAMWEIPQKRMQQLQKKLSKQKQNSNANTSSPVNARTISKAIRRGLNGVGLATHKYSTIESLLNLLKRQYFFLLLSLALKDFFVKVVPWFDTRARCTKSAWKQETRKFLHPMQVRQKWD